MILSSLSAEVEFLSRMVEINTDSVTKSGYDECASVIVQEAERNSLGVEIINGQKAAKDGLSRPNVIVTLDADSDVTLLIESHFDIVPPGSPWAYPPFRLTIQDGRAFGRGTADNKSGIAAAMGALRLLRKEKTLDINLQLIAGVDEEIGGEYGVDYVLSGYGLKGDAGLVVDAGPERLYLGASGIIWGKITVEGKQGHAGYPFKAKNAIGEAIKLVSELEEYQALVEKKESSLTAPPDAPRKFVWGRFTITMIKAWEKENIIPGICEIRFDRRLLPEESVEEAEKELKESFEASVDRIECKASLETIHRLPGYYTPKGHIFVQTVAKNIEKALGECPPFAGELGGNDGSFFAKNGIPVVCYGPIRTDTSYHGVDEFVYLEDLRKIRDVIVSLGKARRHEITSM
jgi:succinyl-diaminopimelate desuccinylase